MLAIKCQFCQGFKVWAYWVALLRPTGRGMPQHQRLLLSSDLKLHHLHLNPFDPLTPFNPFNPNFRLI